MKKITSLLIVVLSLFFLTASSFAIIDSRDAKKISSFESYLGFWQGVNGDTQIVICITKDNTIYTTFSGEYSSTKIYYMTYSTDTNEIYLTSADKIDDIWYKFKLDDNKLALVGLRSGQSIPLSKIFK